jgi:DNA processing protein
MAAEQGKPVYVLPGRVDMPESAGCHALIRDGAQLVTCVEEVLEDLQALPRGLDRRECAHVGTGSKGEGEPELEGLQGDLWRWLRDGQPRHPDRLVQVSEANGPEVQLALLEMEMAGHVARGLDGRYVRS